MSNAKLLYEENWYDVLFRTGQRQEYTLQAAGGSKEVRYLISGAYLNDEGHVGIYLTSDTVSVEFRSSNKTLVIKICT